MKSPFLALACLALLGVIAAQDWLYKPLRNETISSGLTGPYHWWLDASYLVLAVALIGSMRGHVGMELLAVVAALALCLTATTNTFGAWWDAHLGDHSLWHSRFTIVVFVSGLALELAGWNHWRIWLTFFNVAFPAALYARFRWWPTDGIAASPAAEKAYVLVMCLWLITWAL